MPQQNPTGCYRTRFEYAAGAAGRQLRLRFDGVNSAFHVWVNGEFVGYGQDSRLPSEFDISGLVRVGTNQLTVIVYRWSDGSYLEDQDMWWLSGIFRDVSLYSKPRVAIADFQVTPDLDACYRDARLKVRTRLQGPPLTDLSRYQVAVQLFDGDP